MRKSLFTILTIAIAALNAINAQVSIGTQIPIESSILETESTTKGFLPPRMTAAQRDAIYSPANGLTIFNTEQNCLNMWVGYWRNLCAFDNTANIGTISHKGLNYQTVFSPATGLTWLDRNLGATQVATSSNHAASYGDLYQWGRAADGYEKRNTLNYNGSTIRPNSITQTGAWDGRFITVPDATNRNDWVTTQTDNAWNTGTQQAPIKTITDPCPTGYRLPTEAEFNAERLSWNSNTLSGAIASPLKLPAAGFRDRIDGSIYVVGSQGGYWSSTVSGAAARNLRFDSSAEMITNGRAVGLSIRCIKN
jgi:uncharacterized protein (TIGR02145 family)